MKGACSFCMSDCVNYELRFRTSSSRLRHSISVQGVRGVRGVRGVSPIIVGVHASLEQIMQLPLLEFELIAPITAGGAHTNH